jgi:hypothetical protein
MPVRKQIKKEDYHLADLPFDTKEKADAYAQERARNYPEGKPKVIVSKGKNGEPTYWGVYEKVDYSRVREHEARIAAKATKKKGRK